MLKQVILSLLYTYTVNPQLSVTIIGHVIRVSNIRKEQILKWNFIMYHIVLTYHKCSKMYTFHAHIYNISGIPAHRTLSITFLLSQALISYPKLVYERLLKNIKLYPITNTAFVRIDQTSYSLIDFVHRSLNNNKLALGTFFFLFIYQ